MPRPMRSSRATGRRAGADPGSSAAPAGAAGDRPVAAVPHRDPGRRRSGRDCSSGVERWRYRARVVVPRSRRARVSRRRRRRLAGRANDLTDEQWVALVAEWGGCAYCGATDAALQRDCVLPVARGGRYTLANVVPACRACNTSKSGHEVTGWMRRKRLDEAAFLLRHHRITADLARRIAPAPGGPPSGTPDAVG
jgi:5-methylcytosine-specific restriction endonuclease McrA